MGRRTAIQLSHAGETIHPWDRVRMLYCVKGESERRVGTVVRVNAKSVFVIWQGGPADGLGERVMGSLLERAPW